MSNDDNFTVTTTVQAIQREGADITGGTFTVNLLGTNRVWLLRAASPPAGKLQVLNLPAPGFGAKRTLGASEELYCWTDRGTSLIGVLEA